MQKKIAIIGCGNLGQAILKGLIEDKTYPSENITATKRNIEAIGQFKKEGVNITSDNQKAIDDSDIIILALKPYTILDEIENLKSSFRSNHTIVSLATGISIAQITNIIGENSPVFRAMPNTAADVKESVTCICSNTSDKNTVEDVDRFFQLIGTTVHIDESLMESATVIGACGIAYVMRFMRAMVQGGIQIGFDAETANKIVTQTVLGSAQLLLERGQHPEYEIDKVTTPKGCTIVGLNEMEHNGFSSALIKGIIASSKAINE